MRKLSSLNSSLPLKNNSNLLQELKNTNIMTSISKIEEMENLMLTMPQAEIPTNHYFGEDVYVREIFFKKGTVATGLVQKRRHVSIMLSGHMTLWTPFDGLHEVKGPHITEVEPGMKRAGYAHTDVHWLCAYGVRDNDNLSIDEIMDFLTFRKYSDYLSFRDEFVINYLEEN